MRIIPLDDYDDRKEGQAYDCPDKQAADLIAKGLAKAGPTPQNKMAPQSENKANPSQAAGEASQSAVSRAARASQSPIAKPSAGGAKPTRKRGASSQ